MRTETHTCFACGEGIEAPDEPVVIENRRTGNVWHSHPKDECLHQPTPDSYAATARMMASFGGDEMDDDPNFWDRWKDEMKEANLDD